MHVAWRGGSSGLGECGRVTCKSGKGGRGWRKTEAEAVERRERTGDRWDEGGDDVKHALGWFLSWPDQYGCSPSCGSGSGVRPLQTLHLIQQTGSRHGPGCKHTVPEVCLWLTPLRQTKSVAAGKVGVGVKCATFVKKTNPPTADLPRSSTASHTVSSLAWACVTYIIAGKYSERVIPPQARSVLHCSRLRATKTSIFTIQQRQDALYLHTGWWLIYAQRSIADSWINLSLKKKKKRCCYIAKINTSRKFKGPIVYPVSDLYLLSWTLEEHSRMIN